MALEAIKKWMKEHDPHKPVKPEALGKGTRKVSATKPKTKKTTAKTKASTKKTGSKFEPKGKVPVPAQKRDGKTAAVAAKPSDRDVASRTTDKVKPKAAPAKRPSLGVVPKGKQYKSAGIVKSLGILPKKDTKVAKAKTPKFDEAMAKKKKPKEKKAGFLNQLFGG